MPQFAAALKAIKIASAARGVATNRWFWLLLFGVLGLVAMFFVLMIMALTTFMGSRTVDLACTPNGGPDTPYEGAPGGYASQEPSGYALEDIPADYLEEYRAAGEEYGIDWAILAGIGKEETDHGAYGQTGSGCIEGPPTPYGTAKGPMQFIDSTWEASGVDGDGDGQADACNFRDAIPAAAGYLRDNGAPGDYYSAIFAYNRADWYVQDVLAQAERYRAADAEQGGTEEGAEEEGAEEEATEEAAISPEAARQMLALASPVSVAESLGSGLGTSFGASPAYAQEEGGEDAPSEEEGTPGEEEGGGGDPSAVFPLPEEYQTEFTDDWGAARGQGGHEGTDVFAPDGTPMFSITNGTVVPVAGADGDGWNELGGWTVMIEATESVGPVQAGDTLYYAHLESPPSVQPGDQISAGDRIGEVGSTGEGPPGTLLQPPERGQHLHLGWYDPSGSRAEAASGAMNPYPLLVWILDNGGTVTGEGTIPPASSGDSGGSTGTVAPSPCEPEGSSEEGEGGAPGGAPGGGGEYGGGDGAPLDDGSVEELLNHPNFEAEPNSIADLQNGEIDPRLVAVLLRIVEEHEIYVTAMVSNHPYGESLPAGLGGGPNSHAYGLTADIGNVDGVPVVQQQSSEALLNIGRILLDIPPSDRPDETIGPTAWTAELGVTREDGFITDPGFTEAHNDHLHIGYAP